MNKFLIILLTLCILFSSCSKQEDQHLFDTSMDVKFVIPAGLDHINTHYFTFNNIPSFYDQKKAQFGVSDDNITKMTAKNALIVPQFQNVNYGIIRDISIRIFQEDSPKFEAFYLENIDFNEENELKLLSSLTNLKEILSKSTFDLEIRINFKTFTSVTTENILKLNFSAFAEL